MNAKERLLEHRYQRSSGDARCPSAQEHLLSTRQDATRRTPTEAPHHLRRPCVTISSGAVAGSSAPIWCRARQIHGGVLRSLALTAGLWRPVARDKATGIDVHQRTSSKRAASDRDPDRWRCPREQAEPAAPCSFHLGSARISAVTPLPVVSEALPKFAGLPVPFLLASCAR